MTFNDAQKLLDKNNQAQVLRYFDSLNDEEKQGLLKQIENIKIIINVPSPYSPSDGAIEINVLTKSASH